MEKSISTVVWLWLRWFTCIAFGFWLGGMIYSGLIQEKEPEPTIIIEKYVVKSVKWIDKQKKVEYRISNGHFDFWLIDELGKLKVGDTLLYKERVKNGEWVYPASQ